LTGEFAIDRADGSGTILFDLARRDWSAEVLRALDIPAEYLPQTYEGTDVTGSLSPDVAANLGLRAGIPVFGGGGDQAASAVGTGAVIAGVVSLSLVHPGVVFATTDGHPSKPQGRLRLLSFGPGKWHLMGVMLSAAGSLRWHRTICCQHRLRYAAQAGWEIPPGCDGLLFLPYLTGERTPHPDPLARAAFVGLTVRHGFAHLTRAVLEGVSFGLRDSFELMKGAGLANISQVRMTGGGARSPLWRQILADVLQAEIVTVNTTRARQESLTATGAGVPGEAACRATIRPPE
jgi:xylulokinase